jgi:hypothetical protein
MAKALLRTVLNECHARKMFWIKTLILTVLVLFSTHVFAEGSDLLQGTDESFWATLNGTGKKYIYGIEFILAVAMYIKSKNVLVFVGVIAIAVFFNVLLKFIGG